MNSFAAAKIVDLDLIKEKTGENAGQHPKLPAPFYSRRPR